MVVAHRAGRGAAQAEGCRCVGAGVDLSGWVVARHTPSALRGRWALNTVEEALWTSRIGLIDGIQIVAEGAQLTPCSWSALEAIGLTYITLIWCRVIPKPGHTWSAWAAWAAIGASCQAGRAIVNRVGTWYYYSVVAWIAHLAVQWLSQDHSFEAESLASLAALRAFYTSTNKPLGD